MKSIADFSLSLKVLNLFDLTELNTMCQVRHAAPCWKKVNAKFSKKTQMEDLAQLEG
jgi:hypothetical protein